MTSPNATKPVILMVEDELDLREIIVSALTKRMPAFQIIEANSGNKAIAILKQHHVVLIISDYAMSDGNGGELFNYRNQHHPEIPFVLATAYEIKSLPEFVATKPTAMVSKPFSIKDLVKLAKTLLETQNATTAQEANTTSAIGTSQTSTDEQFFGIPMLTLLKTGLLHTDVFIQISGDKYLKLFRPGDHFDQSDYDRYSVKKVDQLYIKQKEFDLFVDSLICDLVSIKDLPKTTASSTAFEISHIAHDTITEGFRKLGITPKIQKLVDESVRHSLRIISTRPKLNELFRQLTEQNGTYLSTHSVALAHVACALSTGLTWQSDFTQTKIILAAFFHDISLTEEDLKQRDHFEKLIQKSTFLNEPAAISYKEHPFRSAEAIRPLPEVPPDVDIIITQHHEMPDGSGFPRGLTLNFISPLSAVIIIAHEIVDELLVKKDDFDLCDFLNSRSDSFSTTKSFSNIMTYLRNSI